MVRSVALRATKLAYLHGVQVFSSTPPFSLPITFSESCRPYCCGAPPAWRKSRSGVFYFAMATASQRADPLAASAWEVPVRQDSPPCSPMPAIVEG
jgi:hypothetical protein